VPLPRARREARRANWYVSRARGVETLAVLDARLSRVTAGPVTTYPPTRLSTPSRRSRGRGSRGCTGAAPGVSPSDAIGESRADDDRLGHVPAQRTGQAARHDRRAKDRRDWPAPCLWVVLLAPEIQADGRERPRRDAGEPVPAALARTHEHGDQLLLVAHRGSRRAAGTSASPNRPRQSTPQAESPTGCTASRSTRRALPAPAHRRWK
jgi:hypothetical protein